VGHHLEPRHLLLPSLAFCLSVNQVFRIEAQRVWVTRLLGGIALAVWLVGIMKAPIPINVATAYRVGEEGKFVLQPVDKNCVLMEPQGSPWYFEGLIWLSKNWFKAERTGWICGDVFYCASVLPVEKVKWFLWDGRDLLQTDPPKIAGREKGAGLACSGHLEYDGTWLSWDFKPESGVSYVILPLVEQIFGVPLPLPEIPVPPKGGITVYFPERSSFLIRCDDLKTMGYSRPLSIGPNKRECSWRAE